MESTCGYPVSITGMAKGQNNGKHFSPRCIQDRPESWRWGVANIDQTPDPQVFIRQLDAMNTDTWRQDHKQRTLAFLNIEEGDHILDIGCGIGDDARLLAQQVGQAGKVVGIDPSATMITEARARSADLSLPVEFY